jgi:hypothetical protein
LYIFFGSVMNRGRGGRGRNAGIRGQIGMLKSSLHGHSNALRSSNPPAFNRIPFNTITVEEDLSTDPTMIGDKASPNYTSGSRNATNIVNALMKQINLSPGSVPSVSGVSLIIKIQRIDLWCMSPSSSAKPPSVRGKFYGLVMQPVTGPNFHTGPLKSLEDIGTQGAAAAVVSYSYPRDQADMPLAAGFQEVLDWKSSDVSQVVFARYHLHWSTADESSFP